MVGIQYIFMEEINTSKMWQAGICYLNYRIYREVWRRVVITTIYELCCGFKYKNYINLKTRISLVDP